MVEEKIVLRRGWIAFKRKIDVGEKRSSGWGNLMLCISVSERPG